MTKTAKRSTNHRPTIGSFLFDYIHSKGVSHAFALPGDFTLPTFVWLDRSPIESITVTHEPSVGFAADGYARVNGLGLAVVTYCVGGLNMLNSIAGAYAEKSPVIVVSGGPGAKDRQSDPLLHHKVKTFDTQRRVYEEVTCANTVLLDPQTAAAEIVRVVDTVIEQRRPGYIEVPYDMPDVPIEPYLPPVREPRQSDRAALSACIDECAAMINKAKRPVILAGVELHRFGLTDVALRIAEKNNIPIAATMLSKSVIRETHPLYIGVYSAALSEPACRKYVDESDCVIMLGTFITDMFLGINTSKLTRKTVILATSEKTQVRFHRYDDVRFDDLLKALGKAKIRKRPAFDNPNPAVEPTPLVKNELHDELTITEVFRILGLHLDDNSAVVTDTGDALFGAIALRTAKRKEFIATAYYCTMGFGIPAAIGVATADSGKRIFVLVGDGAFQMTGMELSTAATRELPLTVIILNNDGYGTQRRILNGPFNEIRRWNYTQVCAMIGAGQADVVETKGQLDGAIRKADSHDGLSVIEVRVDQNDASDALKSLTREIAKLRDPAKQKKAKPAKK